MKEKFNALYTFFYSMFIYNGIKILVICKNILELML